MKKLFSFIWYVIMVSTIVFIDSITKKWALSSCNIEQVINSFLTCELSINRGISWGLLSSDQPLLFVVITVVILLILMWLCHHSWDRFIHNHLIIGEIMVIAGTLGNLIDRYYYAGVVDFIIIHYKDIAFPAVFNVADIFITLGIGIMIITSYEQLW